MTSHRSRGGTGATLLVVVLSLGTAFLLATSAAAALGWVALPHSRPEGHSGAVPVDSSASPGGLARSTSAARGGDAGPTEARDVVRALDLLRGWDGRRAAAYASNDAAALSRLYLSGSDARTADVAMLQRYRSRGLRVTGMRMQVLALEVLRHDERCWRLRVTDRLQHAVAVGHGVRARLPRDQASRRVVTLCRTSPRSAWKVRSVSPPSSGAGSSLSSAPRRAAR